MEKNNCGDWSDEVDYPVRGPGFLCANKKCIHHSLACNGGDNCGDMSDEFFNGFNPMYKPGFKCKNGQCIDKDENCDGYNNCGDWSDEAKPGFLMCSQRCTGEDSYCCEYDTPCLWGEGDCDWDSDCKGDLVCGSNNCSTVGSDSGDDCCVPPPSGVAANMTSIV